MEKEVRVNDIKILDTKTAGKIAAGEVIERPAGVLKELIENSIDSGATVINIDIEKAGKKLIRVNDNGRGIKAEDLPLALMRHSTSKIEHFEDLDNLHTFGFRGEALYSIAAISKLTINSCEENKKGAMLQAEGGKITDQAPAPAIKGTTVEVRDLFFNTPARLKFLKSDMVERSHLLSCAEDAAMANPQIAFNVRTDGNKIYSLTAQNEDEAGIRSRLCKIFGDNIAKSLLFIQDAQFGFKAFVSPLDGMSAARDRQFFFVNRRPVVCKLLQQALYKAYQPYREKDRHPCAVIFMELNAAAFDVNIHPQKKDIKFEDESAVFNFVCSKIGSTLLKNNTSTNIEITSKEKSPQENITAVPQIPPVPQGAKIFSAHNNPWQKESFSPKKETGKFAEFLNVATPKDEPSLAACDSEEPPLYNFGKKEEEKNQTQKQTVYPKNDKTDNVLEQESSCAPAWFKGPYTYIGQLQQSYLLFENPQGLILIDQHAAQERVYFEEYLNQMETSSVQRQPLMFPVSIPLAASKADAVLAWQDFLRDAGFEISRFSAGTLLVNSVPHLLKFKEEDIKDFIISFSDVIGNPAKSDRDFKYRMISTMACKKSIKAGEKLNKAQAEALLENMKKCKDALHCPHGRPTLITLEMKELSRKFGRS